MTIALNTSNVSAVNVVSSLATTNAVTLPSAPTAGSKICYLATVDKSAGTFTAPTGFTIRASLSAASTSFVFAEKTAVGNETGAIAATWTTSRASKAVVFELTTTGTIAYDVMVQNNSETAGTSIASGSVTAGANAAFAVAVVSKDSAKSAVGDADPTVTWTVGGFTTRIQNWTATPSGDPGLVVGTATVSPGSVSATFSHDGSSDQLGIAVIVFSETGTGGGGSGGSGALLAQQRNRRVFA